MQTDVAPEPFQFSLRGILFLTLLVCLLCAALAAQWYGVAFVYSLVVAIGAMAADIVVGRVNRAWTALLLFVALAYAVINVGLFMVVISSDPFSIFGLGFMFLAVIGCPLLAITTVVVFSVIFGKLHWLGVVGFVLWMAGAGFANLWVIAMASASV